MKKTEYNVQRIIILVLFFAMILIYINFFKINNKAIEKTLFFEEKGGFSIAIPESWQVRESASPDLKYRILVGRTENNFTPNINFVDEAFDGELEIFVNAAIESLEVLLGENHEVIQRSVFTTQNGLIGERVRINSYFYHQDNYVRMHIYFFLGDMRVIIITCITLLEAAEAYGELFDRTIKTFRWIE